MTGTKILVTGAAGFIGSWLTKELKRSGYIVIGVDRKDGDLTVSGVIDAMLDEYRPDIVVHLAAQASVLYCEENPTSAVLNNVVTPLLVAMACGRRGGIRLVYASTSEVYGDRMMGGELCHEDGPLGKPLNIYAWTKQLGEAACQRFDSKDRFAAKDLLILRLSMPFGPFQETSTSPRLVRHRAAVINFLWQALHHQPMIVHTGSERSLCWIEDTARAIRILIEQGQTGIWNVGRDDDRRSMKEIAELACKLADAPTGLIQMVEPPGYRTVVKNLSMQKIRSTGWRPEVSLEDAMRRTLEWVKTLPSP